MLSDEAIALKSEIDKLNFYNTTLLNLIAAMGKDDPQPLTVYEAIVVHEICQKSNLRALYS